MDQDSDFVMVVGCKDVKILIPSNEEDDLSVPVPPSLIYDVNGIAIAKILQNISKS
jgi:hypothetical protein